MKLSLPVTYCCYEMPYGPGMERPSCPREGPQTAVLPIDPGRTAIVAMHIWNLGEQDGPYPFAEDAEPTGTTGDWVLRARDITRDLIAPLLTAARRVGIALIHNAGPTYADRYASHRELTQDSEYREPRVPTAGCVRPFSVADRRALRYGGHFPGHVADTHRDVLDIAASCRPYGNEPVVVDGWQTNQWCREHDIDTLLYVGFVANFCVLDSPGGIREMATRFNYRVVLLTDATTAHEFPDTVEGEQMAFFVARQVQYRFGFTALADDLRQRLDTVSN
ncbi:MAG: hypothetical protein HN742_02130 [Lentisphaerae bacterium]|jgi:hypothetical protein|nr:hypothetical protein [Lentisphaerota bacterium]MBT4819256.1 hypothetical protein [Lentisphaerota bacterium]MBT5610215.1 hypothetical protein [Lentisphaerota bacterium]MBT7060035.1 hypothetical protein [Lentisphaerota bacterium]MBT7840635.1 hypothetical protein [Lentisphaerota bacterium]